MCCGGGGGRGCACVYVDWPAVSDLDVTVVLCGATSIADVNCSGQFKTVY